MKQSTIDGIIETFDESYHKNKNDLYLKHKSVDKFVELSYDYATGLQADNIEKEMFASYFENHVKSLYRRDFEKDVLKEDRKKISCPKDIMVLNYAIWGFGFGAAGSLIPFILTKSPDAAAVGSLVGVMGGLFLAYEGSKGDRSKIVGTKQYDKKLRKELNKALVYA